MKHNLTRRDFGLLTAAAAGGLMVGCSSESGGGKDGTKPAAGGEASWVLGEKNLCRGLNACKGKGAGGKNECAGLGSCATVAKHDCGGKNDCKNLGGCGETVGTNSCKTKGNCAVPLMDKAWVSARASFEKAYQAKNGKAPGDAPGKAKG